MKSRDIETGKARPRTSARLTGGGRTAFKQHVAALQQLVEQSGVSVLPG